MKRAWWPALLAVGLLASGCRFTRKPKAPAPPPAPPPVVAPKAEPSLVEPPQVETPKPLPPQAVPAPVSPAAQPVPPPPSAPKPSRRPRPVRASKPAPVAPAGAPQTMGPAVVPTPETPLAAPGLGEVLAPERSRQYEAQLAANAGAIRRVLASLRGRTLTSGQNESVARIRSFLDQAEKLRRVDLPSAAALALRGALLAKDLAAGLR